MKINKYSLFFAYLVFLILSFEAISYLGYYIYQKKFFSFTELQNYRTAIGTQQNSNFALQPIIAHPYLGNVHNLDSNMKIGVIGVNEYGFLDDKSSIQKKSEDKLIVGIFGASVSWWFSTLGYQDLINKLQIAYPKKKIEILRYGLGGNKQPQQLMILNYMLINNAEFDIIINIDGFNEVAIPPTHNRPKGVNPIFPAYWSDSVGEAGSKEERELLAKILIAEQKRKDLAQFFSRTPLKQSISANLVWLILEKSKITLSENLKLEKQNLKNTNQAPFVIRGPKVEFESDEKYYDLLTDHWSNGSLLMNELCKAKGIKYFHFLQPNQYVPNSKPIGEEERKVAFENTEHWQKPVLMGYPLLSKKGAELKSKGVKFFDLTQIFKDKKQALYIDNCCHLNIDGNQIMGREIGQIIIDNL